MKKLFKPAPVQPIQGTWYDQPPGPGAVHMGRYTPVLKVRQNSTNPQNDAAATWQAPVKPRTTI